MPVPHEENVKGKVYVVTGGSTGIGYSLVTRLAKLGAKVVIANRNEADGQKAVADCASISGRPASEFLFVKTDVTNNEECVKLHNTAIEKFGGYDGLVLNSGGSPADRNTFLQWDDAVGGFHDGWLDDLKLNLIAPLYSARLAAKYWNDTGRDGVLVFTVSYYAYAPCPIPVYGLSKCALNHFAHNVSSMAKEGFPLFKNFAKIRINTITPGYVWTPIFRAPPEEVEKSPFMGGHIKQLGGWVNMDHLIDEFVGLLADPEANNKAVITPTGDKSIYPKQFPESAITLPLCEVPEGFKSETSLGASKSIF
ncbi:hypothetical protein DFJ74DRAFT_702574 [Hyaloraphidium curvatum]|nr:hypothetical protein DFJ74DRAFT_702574 [Hyaloraphidium curvatum]